MNTTSPATREKARQQHAQFRGAVHSSRVCELCEPRNSAAMRALEFLTPSGSEFVNEIERCVSFVQERLRMTVEYARRDKAKREALEKIGNLIGAPTVTYANSYYQLEALRQRLQDISKIVQEALK